MTAKPPLRNSGLLTARIRKMTQIVLKKGAGVRNLRKQLRKVLNVTYG